MSVARASSRLFYHIPRRVTPPAAPFSNVVSRAWRHHSGTASLTSIKTARQFSSSRSSNFSAAMEPKFSEGADVDQLKAETTELLENEWTLDSDQMGFEKTFYFPNFTKALDFATTVGIRCKSKNHHPTMTIKFGSVHIHWTTHHPRGLSAKDTFMARYCDEQAKIIGAVKKGEHAKCAPAPGSKA